MTSRERVIEALAFRKPDRIPRYEIFLPGYIDNWRKAKKLSEDEWIYDYYEGIDIGTIVADQNGPYFSKAAILKREGSAYYELDSWGRTLYKKDDAFFEKEIDVAVKEKGKEPTFESPLMDKRRKIFMNIPDSLNKRFAIVSGVLGLYMGCSRLRGEVQFLMDLAEDQDYCKYLVGHLADFITQLGLSIVDITNTKDTAIWVYDELSSRTGPLFSPDTFYKIFYPHYKNMIDTWKQNGVKNIILHCDGNSLPLLDMLIEAGFTGLQSLHPTTGMWLPDVKAKYGKKLALIGGMCNIHTLATGTKNQIEKEARSIIEAGKDGGVIIGSHSIDEDIPVENYDFYYSVLDKYN